MNQTLRLLLKTNARLQVTHPNADQETALNCHLRHGMAEHYGKIAIALLYHVDKEGINQTYTTPEQPVERANALVNIVCYAPSDCRLTLIKRIIEIGINPTLYMKDQWDALALACNRYNHKDYLEVVEYLMTGPFKDQLDNIFEKNYSYLIVGLISARQDQIHDFMELWLKHGSRPVCGTPTTFGWTPLMVALARPPNSTRQSTVKPLITAGAWQTINHQEQHGKTALTISQEVGDEEVTHLLEKCGAKTEASSTSPATTSYDFDNLGPMWASPSYQGKSGPF